VSERLSARDIGGAIREIANILDRGGIADSQREAGTLICAVLGVDRAVIMAHPEMTIHPYAATLAEASQRRANREPLSRIVSRREFYGREFQITPDTLDPRPETETLVEAVIALLDRGPTPINNPRILDLGTGSGCLLITLLAELAHASGIGVDLLPGALEVAMSNAMRLGVSDRARFICGDWCEALSGTFDIVVSNPPYIGRYAIGDLDPEVSRFDPHAALDGGVDGLDFYRRLGSDSGRLLPDGWLVVEVGVRQAEAVERILTETLPSTRKPAYARRWSDLSGVERVVAIGYGDESRIHQ
jgi:release factor glutamine methyltransferase